MLMKILGEARTSFGLEPRIQWDSLRSSRAHKLGRDVDPQRDRRARQVPRRSDGDLSFTTDDEHVGRGGGSRSATLAPCATERHRRQRRLLSSEYLAHMYCNW